MATFTRTSTIVLGAVDAVLIVLAGILTVATYVELRSPGADPLTGIGYFFAGMLALLAAVSLLLTLVGTAARGPWRVVCLVVAVIPLLPIAAMVFATWWS